MLSKRRTNVGQGYRLTKDSAGDLVRRQQEVNVVGDVGQVCQIYVSG